MNKSISIASINLLNHDSTCNTQITIKPSMPNANSVIFSLNDFRSYQIPPPYNCTPTSIYPTCSFLEIGFTFKQGESVCAPTIENPPLPC